MAFNVVNQTKLAFTALFSRLIVGRRQSPVQCVALALVTLGGVLVSAGLGSSPIDAHHNEGNPRLGLLCALAAAALSGLSSGTMEGALQKRDAFLLSMEMAAIGCLVLLCSVGCPFTADGQMWRSEGLFTRWRPLTFVPVAVQGVSGILIGIITKVAGGVRKVIATICGLGLTCVLQQLVYGELPSLVVCIAVPLVASGTYLHAQHPPKVRQVMEAAKLV